MAESHNVRSDPVDVLRQLRTHLDAIEIHVRGQNASGWQQGALGTLRSEAAQLQDTVAQVAPQLAEAFTPLMAALHDASNASQPPTHATGSALLTATGQVRTLLPPLPSEAARVVAATAQEPARAEYPPPHYWRRWSGDAAAAHLPDVMGPALIEPDAKGPALIKSALIESALNISAAINSAPIDAPSASPAVAAPEPEAGQADETPYRVLVVEDDRSQALFAQGVLSGAGMQAQVTMVPGEVLQVMEEFRPDLVLMDLHMPGLSGTELTGMIREHPVFAHTPIVFLTGDPDPERQYEVLESGADDFLSKPIRPRHLIAAVQSRVKRARMLQRQHLGDNGRHPLTGLYTRPYLVQRMAHALADAASGGALFVEIQNAGALRDRYGYAGFEQLMHDASQRIGQLAGACPTARLNDNAFLVFVPDGNEPQLEAVARGLRDGISHPPFDRDGMPQRLRAAIGYTTLAHGFAAAGSVLDAAEQAARLARSLPIGLAAYAPVVEVGHDAGLVAAIHAGLQEDGFELLFQPIVAVAGGDEAQFQVLVRLRDGDGVVHTAGEIVPVAETAGLMPDIDRWVLGQAIELLRQRHDRQRLDRLFVSQSSRTLARDLHAEWLLEMLSTHAIAGPSLVIDLRLDDALVHSVTLRQFCDQLMPVGVQFCLSQYAHGDEANALLSQLPLGYLRLSPRYSHAHVNSELRDELRGVIDRAHRLGLQVIGQQVEDPQGAATLWMSGIDYIQGDLVQQAAGELDFDFQNSVL